LDAAEQVATALIADVGETTAEGQTYQIDARLRPEGGQGPLARSLAGYERYYDQWALTWERQALVKARVVAGDRALGEQFCELVARAVYGRPFTDDDTREVRRMKARIERERIPPGEDPQYHLKLGRGSLSDVEFCVQLLQLQRGGTEPSVQTPSTKDAIEALRRASLLDEGDADALDAAYRFCQRARNARFLQTGRVGDALPAESTARAQLGRLLGYVHQPDSSLRDEYRRLTRRSRRVVERVFYGT
jgi:glutamate-ammonia-ligase adenylyltransferase